MIEDRLRKVYEKVVSAHVFIAEDFALKIILCIWIKSSLVSAG